MIKTTVCPLCKGKRPGCIDGAVNKASVEAKRVAKRLRKGWNPSKPMAIEWPNV